MENANKFLLFSGAAVAALLLFSEENNDNGNLSVIQTPKATLTPTEFVRAYSGYAYQSQFATNVPALVTLAQAALESGWGKHAPQFNFFGIKANKSWKGATQKIKTWECGSTGNKTTDNITDEVIAVYSPSSANGFKGCSSKGKYSYRTWAKFRAYQNAGQSFLDHDNFLRNNSRYAPAFKTNTAEAFARAVAAAGYASTTSGYADLLVQLINRIRNIQETISGTVAADPIGPHQSGDLIKSTYPIRLHS